MLTSQGFHTFLMALKLSMRSRNSLLNDFKNYEKETGLIRVRPMKNQCGNIIPNCHIVEYTQKNSGISFLIIHNVYSTDFPYVVKAIINPKILSGTADYVTAATSEIMQKVIITFNREVRKISHVLKNFYYYTLQRIDYCINFDVKELGLGCSPEQMIKLIKQADIPPHFSERVEYNTTSHRRKTDNFSFYLQCKSVVVNCYWKHWQLFNEYPDCPDLNRSYNVIRFEIQCKYAKVYNMSKLLEISQGYWKVIDEMFSDSLASQVLTRYFNKIIGAGNYYTLDAARKMILRRNFKLQKEHRLISTLEFVNSMRGIANAKSALKNADNSDEFNRSLRELNELGINPVTIPKDWGIKTIPNLLCTYYNKLSNLHFDALQEERLMEMLKEYLPSK